MGWSCSEGAGKTIDAWRAYCVSQTKQANLFVDSGTEYIVQVSSTEHDDGAITGSIMAVIERLPGDVRRCRKAGTFRVEPDGRVSRGPAVLKKLAVIS